MTVRKSRPNYILRRLQASVPPITADRPDTRRIRAKIWTGVLSPVAASTPPNGAGLGEGLALGEGMGLGEGLGLGEGHGVDEGLALAHGLNNDQALDQGRRCKEVFRLRVTRDSCVARAAE